MSVYYTIVQCIPDPLADERINIGVIVYGDGRIRSRFLSSWRRVKLFGVEDSQFLTDFADRVTAADAQQMKLNGVPAPPSFNTELLERAIGSWSNSIQFTPPRGSLRDPDTVLEDIASRVLHDPLQTKRATRTRATAAKIVREVVERQFAGVLDQSLIERHVHVRPQLPGKLDPKNPIDIAVANGDWRFGGYGLSFEISDFDQLDADRTKAAFRISDVKYQMTNLPIGVLTLPPTPNASPRITTLYIDTVRILTNAGAVVLTEDEYDQWVESQMRVLVH